MTEHVHRLPSTFLDNERTVWVRPPIARRKPECLAVFLDAELYRDRVGATQIVDELQHGRQIPPCLSVFVSSQSEEARWIECPCHLPFAEFIDREFLPWLDGHYPGLISLPKRVLVGLSYTGLAAAFVALQLPTRFTRIVAQSGSFWWNNGHLIDRYRSLDGRLPSEFYLDVGTQETQANLQHKEDVVQEISQIEGVRRFRDALQAKGHHPEYVEFDGGHHFDAWSRTLPHALIWALAE